MLNSGQDESTAEIPVTKKVPGVSPVAECDPRVHRPTVAPAPRTTGRSIIVGHFGGCNTGDEAMLAGLLEAVGPEMRRQFAVVVKDRRRMEWLRQRLGVEPVPAGLRAVLRALRRADALVLCGGTHFHDDYLMRRYLRHLRYMFRYVSLSMLSKLMGKRVTWLGMGFGPFYRWPTRWITRLGLSLCDRVSVRDRRSFEEVAGWVAPERLDLTFDLAALLTRNRRGRQVRRRAEPFRCVTLGLSVTSVCQSRSVGRRTDEVIWRRLARAVNRTLEENPVLRVRVMVLRGGNREDDEGVSAQLHRAIASIHPGRTEIIPYHPEPTVTWQRDRKSVV